jgi:hypothetical protein
MPPVPQASPKSHQHRDADECTRSDTQVSLAFRTMSDLIRIGGRSCSTTDAERWITEYFSPENRTSSTPYAHPAYDEYDSGSGPFELNDGDLLAPALLNAAPTMRAFYSLQSVRSQLTDALARTPVELTLQDAAAVGTAPALVGDLAAVLDATPRPPGVRLTTLFKVLHRKRPLLVPLYDQFVRACYVGDSAFPVHRVRSRSWRNYAVAVATAVNQDLSTQEEAFADLHRLAPQVTQLRLLDVLAWKVGRRAPEDDFVGIRD